MINIDIVKKQFLNYVSNYNPNNERIKLKIEHIQRVAKNCELVAQNLNLSKNEINLAIAIGYFHDLGRFEQVRIANTFSDKESKINHGEMSVKVLFENNLIRKMIPESDYDEIIKKAVLNHNRFKIEDGLTEKELLFSKIIRDADKLDIFYSISCPEYSMESIFWYDNWDIEKISDIMMNDFEKNHYSNYSKITNNADVITIFYSYVYDLYFPISLKVIYENKYLDKFSERVYSKFPSTTIHEQTKKLLQSCNNYLKTVTI